MYRVMSNQQVKPEGKICIDFEITFFDDVFQQAPLEASNLTHPKNIPFEERLDPGAFAVYDSFLDSIISYIHGAGLTVGKDYTSNWSYAHYIPFKDDDNHEFEFKFRVANHAAKGSDDEYAVMGNGFVLRTISIGDKMEFTSPIAAIKAVGDMCKEIKAGNIDILFKYYGAKRESGR